MCLQGLVAGLRIRVVCQGRAAVLREGSAREQSTAWAVAQGGGIAPAPAAGSGVAGPAGNGQKAQADTSGMAGWGGWVAAE